MKIRILNLSRFPNPNYESSGASGLDLRANIENPVILRLNEVEVIPTGIYLDLPKGYEAQVRARSGLAAKHGITLVNGIGTIDSDYRGEIKVILSNLTKEDYTVMPGERIAQLVFSRLVLPELDYVSDLEELTPTIRGEGGFGHSGKS